MKQTVFLLAAVFFFVACGGGTNSKKQATGQTAQPKQTEIADVTEVLYFHGKQRCITCNAIEKLTKEVVDSLANAKVVLKIIDISQKENEAVADKYEVTWSSLILARNGKVENLTDMGFGYAKGQPDVFKAKLTEAINGMVK